MAFLKCCIYGALFVWLCTGAILNWAQYEQLRAREIRERVWIEEIKPRVQPRPSVKWSERAIDGSILGIKNIDRTPFTAQQLNP